MSDGKDAQEPSMEEILSSIRRIIADEQDDGDRQPAAKDARGPAAPGRAAAADESDDDVLELTEIAPDEPDRPAPPLRPLADTPAVTPLHRAERDADLTRPTPAPAAPAPRSLTKEKSPVAAFEQEDGLVSSTAASASTNAFARLTRAAASEERSPPPQDSGKTVEQLVTEMMRPLLKDWLDANLPQIVERVVEQEVKKLARRAELL